MKEASDGAGIVEGVELELGEAPGRGRTRMLDILIED